MTAFEPLAVVGRGCVLPGALTPAALWTNVVEGVSSVTPVPDGRWGLDPERILSTPSTTLDVTHATEGGYVQGFDQVFDASGLRIGEDVLREFDPVVKWPLHAARDALREAGLGDVEPVHKERTAVILGNLSFPTAGMARFGERVYLEAQADFGGPLSAALAATAKARGGRAADRFMSGLPAQLVATALGLEGEAFCLDAACASSLYAVSLAANALHARRADVVLCGAVNAADSLFIHVGFTALGALSPSGQTRPFHREANGLIPGEGAGVVALMRLDDARAEGRQVFGVVRGVGLSNDGRGRNLLAPSSEGQVRSLQAAYASAQISPEAVSLIECHATGTPVGDGTEIESMRAVFGDAPPNSIGIGSLKSNLGHLITGAGVAGMLKVMGAFEHKTLPPTLHASDPLSVFNDDSLPFELLQRARPWADSSGAFAGVSAFGFGGNNAHVVMQAPTNAPVDLPSEILQTPEPVAITALGYRSRTCESVEAWDQERVSSHFDASTMFKANADAEIRVDAKGVRFPPNALKASLPQQLLTFEAVREAIAPLEAEIERGTVDRNRVGVIVGMQCDVDVTTPGIRWRLAEWADPTNEAPEWVERLRDAVGPVVTAERVLGQMPNIPANRANVQHDLRGLGFTVSSEEMSGLNGLRIAEDLLANETLDAVVVAAVDVCDDDRHQAATKELVGRTVKPDDAAVAVVLRRVRDVTENERVLATLDEVELGATTRPTKPGDHAVAATGSTASPSGHPQAASGLVAVAASVLDLARRTTAEGHLSLSSTAQRTHVTSLGGARGSATVRVTHDDTVTAATGLPLVLALSGPDRHALVAQAKDLANSRDRLEQALAAPAPSNAGARLAVVGQTVDVIADRLASIDGALEGDRDVVFSDGPALRQDQVALAFGGAASPPHGVGASLLQAFPSVRTFLSDATGDLSTAFVANRHFSKGQSRKSTSYLDELLVGSSLMQTHAAVVRNEFGLSETAAIGLSLGEANALMAFGAWKPNVLLHSVQERPLFRDVVAGTFSAAVDFFEAHAIGVEDPVWTSAVVRGDVEEMVAAADREPGAFVSLIHADDECVVAGAPSAVRRALAAVSRQGAFIPSAPAVHALAARAAEAEYRALHTIPTTSISNTVYSAGSLSLTSNARLTVTEQGCADAITAQALGRVDFPALVRAANDDGIRLIVAMGSRGLCAEWTRRIETSTPVAALALHRADTPEPLQLARVAAGLFARGLPVSLKAFSTPGEKPGAIYFGVPAHRAFPPLPLPLADAPESGRGNNDKHSALPSSSPEGAEDLSMPHAPRLPLPPFSSQQVTAAPASSEMTPAPRLGGTPSPPTSTAGTMKPPLAPAPHTPDTTPSAAQHPAPMPSAPVHAAPAAVAQPAASGPWTTVAQAHADLGQAHRDYVENASQMHQTFLEMQKRQMETLAAAMSGQSPLPTGHIPAGSNAPSTSPLAAPPSLSATNQPTIAEQPTASAVVPAPVKPAVVAKPALVNRPPSAAKSATRETTASKPRPTSTGEAFNDGTRANPWLNRSALERVASDKISSVLGEVFERQDGFRRQVRMPEPPLLLCDRVLCTDAKPGVLEKGRTIWTESDVTVDKWYLHCGRVPPSVLIESGQADLLLISWMGVDFENAGQRVYRLLGCDLTYGDALPKVGDTLHYDIHIDGFARTGSTHMFFFHSDCRVGGPDGEIVLSVRNGQAGFFDDAELDNSGGILWTPSDLEEDLSQVPLAKPAVETVKASITKEELIAWTEGDGFKCFGPGYERLAPHVRTPSIQGDTGHGQDMRLIDRVTNVDPVGGPWKRGYLRAELDLFPEQWFFQGHFKDDPCMPGTIMFEGCLQTLSTYLAALGLTFAADGYRFEPVGHKPYSLRCRGQATPTSKNLVYEVFVKEVVGGDLPRVRADILVTVDGLKALFCDDVELELVVDWPMSDRFDLLGLAPKKDGTDAVGGVVLDGTPAPESIFDQSALLATGWGKPSDAFGEMYRPFDGTRSVPRLPGPPYHFMSRVTELEGPPAGSMKAGVECAVEYDVPADAWYFDASPAQTMPFCVLLEVALQPCGWLSSYVGSALTSENDLFYRNLDGQGTLHAEIPKDVGTLITRASMTKSAMSGGMIIQEFSLSVTARGADDVERPVYDATTAFGFFPAQALSQQVGVGSTPDEKAALAAPSPVDSFVVLDTPRLFDGPVKLPKAPLLMIDKVTGQWPASDGNLGRVRTEKTVDVTEWFFKAHFFQDPVQPGSLGIEAMIQAVTYWMIDADMGADMKAPRVTPIGLGAKMVWKYRGQVIPRNKRIEVEAIIRSKTDTSVVADCALWVDGLRIYTAEGLAVGLVDG